MCPLNPKTKDQMIWLFNLDYYNTQKSDFFGFEEMPMSVSKRSSNLV